VVVGTPEVCRIEGAAEGGGQTGPGGQQELGAVQPSRARRQRAGKGPGGQGLEVAHVAAAGQVRLGRPCADHDPGEGEAAVRHRLERQRGVVEGAERRVDHDQHVGRELVRQVRNGRALLVVPNQKSTGTLDEHQVALVGERTDPGRGRPQVERVQTAMPSGGGGGERVGVPRQLVQVRHARQPAYLRQVTRLVGVDTGLGRFHDRHPGPAGRRQRCHSGGDDRLPDPGPRPGHDQHTHEPDFMPTCVSAMTDGAAPRPDADGAWVDPNPRASRPRQPSPFWGTVR